MSPPHYTKYYCGIVDYIGRQVYHVQGGNVYNTNDFRYDRQLRSRHHTGTGKNIQDIIFLKHQTDQLIYEELETLQEQACNNTYSSYYSLQIESKFYISNIESHSFSKNGYHIAHVASLSSYKQMDFSCWDGVTNQIMQQVLQGQMPLPDNEKAILEQTLSLFLCESSRNPSSFLTAPMCFELSEWLYHNPQYKQKFLCIEKSEEYNKMQQKQEKLNKNSLERQTIKQEMKDLKNHYKDIVNNHVAKSVIIKQVMLDYFPMAIEGAVAGSRTIRDIINQFTQNLELCYDNKQGSVAKAKHLLDVEVKLIENWSAIKMQNSTYQPSLKPVSEQSFLTMCNQLVKDWYGYDCPILDKTEQQEIYNIGVCFNENAMFSD